MRKLFWALAVMTALAGSLLAQTNPVSTGGVLTSASTDCSTTTSCVTLMFSANNATVTIQLAGTFNETVSFEVTGDGSNWVPFPGTSNTGTSASSTTSTGLWQFATAGLSGIRARSSIYTSGGASIFIQSSAGATGGGGSGGGSGSTNATIVSPLGLATADAARVSVILPSTQVTSTGQAGQLNSLPVVQASDTPAWITLCITTSNIVSGSTTITTISTSSVIAATGSASTRNYIFGAQLANTGSTNNVLVGFRDGVAGSFLTYSVAPNTYGGSNITFNPPLVQTANTALIVSTDAASSTVYISVQGCKGP